MNRFAKAVIGTVLIFSFTLLDFSAQTAQAKMIDTETVVMATRNREARDKITAFLERQDVQRAMAGQHVSMAEAQKRVAALTDDEVRQINQAMDKLPAGGDGLGVIVGAGLFVFIVLLITDILGFTHVFNFVHHHRR